MIDGSIVFLHRIWYDGSYGNEEETDTGVEVKEETVED